MLADLHIHSKYSSHALYINKKRVTDRLKSKYSSNDLFDGNLDFLSKFFVDGTSHIRSILKLAKTRGLQCIAITDHNTTIGNLEAQKLSSEFGIIVVPAMELSTDSGEILCYGITRKIKKGLPIKDAIKQVHDQGGIVVAAHPFNPKHPNIDFARLDEELIRTLNLDAIEVFSPIKGRVDPYFLDLAKQLNLGVIGGSDAHINYQIGKGITVLPDSCKTYKDVIQAIKNQNTYATGTRLNYFRVLVDLLWCMSFGRLFINRKWGYE